EKRVLRRLALSVEQTSGALEPALRHTFFAAEGGAVPADPDGEAGGRYHVAAAAVCTVGALARGEHDVGEVQPPCGEAETLERLERGRRHRPRRPAEPG